MISPSLLSQNFLFQVPPPTTSLASNAGSCQRFTICFAETSLNANFRMELKLEGKHDDKKDHIVFSAYKLEDLTVEDHYNKSIVMTDPCYDKSM